MFYAIHKLWGFLQVLQQRSALSMNVLPLRHGKGCRLFVSGFKTCTQTGGPQLNVTVLIHGPLEILLPNIETIHLYF